MVDRQLILEKVAFIEDNLRKLRRLRAMSPDDFLSEFFYIDSAKHNLQTAIEAMQDIAQHVIAFHRWRLPTGNADAFQVLVEQGVLPAEDGNVFAQMARFRNRVVHIYSDVDPLEIYKILQEHLVDFERFAGWVAKRFLADTPST